ncbi:MAG: hypothetical protein COT89_02270 [Candidatus Colwellbacteria bacterium CG10_big_fil_rev_8_21_14_0_10_42_22]|uniref:TIGR00341 family protein n=1 Tax=Candidatus Colwellbacteria bacterium CG10_big_fil_rev_8_21_14_0_10_42_22 TaxID=1974540 RepID=A0A2H0VFI1_9BACT|nr:MAG: hypothetical protein COT89_02270 [Candidatus Colwellbacteria bacterium CG10_big_fil_rev_8_21_14_0_10_42_22]
MPQKKRINKDEDDILAIKARDQYKTIDELVKKSKPNSVYYTLLIISSLIIAFGLLLGNSTVVIGGMLVTPVLTPILFIALGIVTGELGLIKSVGQLIAKSFAIVFASGLVAAWIFGTGGSSLNFIENDITVPALYFSVALLAGAAATFAWTRKDVVDILPGVAIAVALVPPLTLSGIGLSLLNVTLVRINFLIFLFNVFGVIIGSLIVFSLLGFYKTKERVHREAEVVEKETKRTSKKK